MAKVKKCSTNRGVIKFYLFTILTLGIYAIVFWVRFGNDLNRVKEKAGIEGSSLMNFVGAMFLGLITFGIVPLVWVLKVICRTYHAANVLGTKSKGSIATAIIFYTLLSWTIVCPIIAAHNLFATANNLGKWYNQDELELLSKKEDENNESTSMA